MKKISLFLILALGISGCNLLPATTTTSDAECPEQPKGLLDTKDVTPINLSNSVTKISGRATVNKSMGYTFEGKKGTKVNYRTTDNICLWIFGPDNSILSSVDLPQDGKYTLQVATPKGSTTFNIDISLGTLASSPSIASTRPSVSAAPPTSVAPPVAPPPSTPNTSGMSQREAVELVQNWLNSKGKIFGPPWNYRLVEDYTTGLLYQDITKPDGSIKWLQNNGCRHHYYASRINEVISFDDVTPALTVTIYESRDLYGPKSVGCGKHSEYTRQYTYYFAQSSGSWKITDYR